MLLHRKNDRRDASSMSLIAVDGAGRARSAGSCFDAIDEPRRDEHAGQRLLDARLEVAVLAPLAIERHQRVDLGGVTGPRYARRASALRIVRAHGRLLPPALAGRAE